VLDAFSFDAIPVHLLTREALAGYLSRLAPRGIIVLHISNRHMALGRVAASVGAAERLVVFGTNQPAHEKADDWLWAPAEVVVFARDRRDFGDLAAQPGWKGLDPDSRVSWTVYADILRAILDRKLRR
jgi:hypothetical protein